MSKLVRIWIAIVALTVLCGCHRQRTGSLQAVAIEPFAHEWRPDDVRFTPREREIVAAARDYLEKERKKPIDGYYGVEHTKDGYEVLVWFVAGYKDGQPQFMPGGNCIVSLREDGSVIRVLLGR